MLPAIIRVVSFLALAILRLFSVNAVQDSQELCIDKSPYCNVNDCTVRPGYALQFCRRTCGQCGDFCQDSIYVSCREERKDECDQMLKDYCPILCGLCTIANKTIKETVKQTKPEKYKIFDKGLSTTLQTTASTLKIDETRADGMTKMSLNGEFTPTTLIIPITRKSPKRKSKKTSKKPTTIPISTTIETSSSQFTKDENNALAEDFNFVSNSSKSTSPSIGTRPTPPVNFNRPEKRMGVTTTIITLPTSDDPFEQEETTIPIQEEDIEDPSFNHPTRVFPQMQAEIDRNEAEISEWATNELLSRPVHHMIPFNPYFVPRHSKMGYGDASQWSNGLFSDDRENEDDGLPNPLPLTAYQPLRPMPVILQNTTPVWTFLGNPRRFPNRKQTAIRIPKPKPLTIDAVDMNLLDAEEEKTTDQTMVPTFTPTHPQQGPEWRYTGLPFHFGEQSNHIDQPQDDAQTFSQIERPYPQKTVFEKVSMELEKENNFRFPNRPLHRKATNQPPYVQNTKNPSVSSAEVNPMKLTDLITLLGCRDRDPTTCSQISEETCHSRPGYYLKLCPVKCRNCNGLLCYDSIKIDCSEVKKRGGCKLPLASEYCPRTCNLCPSTPSFMEGVSPCKDELDTCEPLATTGVCEHPYSQPALRIYCAKSCGFCKESQYYMNEPKNKDKLNKKLKKSRYFQRREKN